MKIPLFPLNIIVLPYEEVPLHIFEPRYKKMIKNSIKENSPFGIVLDNSGNIDNLGCSLYVTKIIKEYKIIYILTGFTAIFTVYTGILYVYTNRLLIKKYLKGNN